MGHFETSAVLSYLLAYASVKSAMIMHQHFVSLTLHQLWMVALCKWLTFYLPLHPSLPPSLSILHSSPSLSLLPSPHFSVPNPPSLLSTPLPLFCLIPLPSLPSFLPLYG